MLDLDEALEELGYGTALVPADFESLAVVDRPPGKEKAPTAVHGEKRRYVRHPPGTPRWKMGDRAKWLEAKRRYVRKSRLRKKQERLMSEAKRIQEFVDSLTREGLESAAKMICIGRFLLDDETNRPQISMLLLDEPDSLAARIDFAMYLTHPLRGWTVERVARLFEAPHATVSRWIASREKKQAR